MGLSRTPELLVVVLVAAAADEINNLNFEICYERTLQSEIQASSLIFKLLTSIFMLFQRQCILELFRVCCATDTD